MASRLLPRTSDVSGWLLTRLRTYPFARLRATNSSLVRAVRALADGFGARCRAASSRGRTDRGPIGPRARSAAPSAAHQKSISTRGRRHRSCSTQVRGAIPGRWPARAGTGARSVRSGAPSHAAAAISSSPDCRIAVRHGRLCRSEAGKTLYSWPTRRRYVRFCRSEAGKTLCPVQRPRSIGANGSAHQDRKDNVFSRVAQ